MKNEAHRDNLHEGFRKVDKSEYRLNKVKFFVIGGGRISIRVVMDAKDHRV